MQHLAVIMDGNRRWAKKRLLRPWKGHEEGARTIRAVMEFCLERSIAYLSLYAFSLENFKRAPDEVTFLFELFVKQAHAEKENLKNEGVRVQFIGDRTLFPDTVIPAIDELEKYTQDNSKLFLQLLFCYGGQQEITAAVKRIATDVQKGLVSIDEITPAFLSRSLWTGAFPEPELIIRTGGKQRLSNFLLYQAAYSELHFLDCLWPDLEKGHLNAAFQKFQNEQRNFGI